MHIDMCMHMCMEVRMDMRIDMSIHMCIDMNIDMCVDMCLDMRVDMRMDMRIDTCIDMCKQHGSSRTWVAAGAYVAHVVVGAESEVPTSTFCYLFIFGNAHVCTQRKGDAFTAICVDSARTPARVCMHPHVHAWRARACVKRVRGAQCFIPQSGGKCFMQSIPHV